MRKHYIDIVGKWAIIFAYGIGERDLEEVASWLEALGCNEGDISEACRVIMRPNSGFTVSNPSLRMSVLCVGNATSEEQWLDTLVHELKHVQSHICDYYGVEEDSEEASYLIGYAARLIFKNLR